MDKKSGLLYDLEKINNLIMKTGINTPFFSNPFGPSAEEENRALENIKNAIKVSQRSSEKLFNKSKTKSNFPTWKIVRRYMKMNKKKINQIIGLDFIYQM